MTTSLPMSITLAVMFGLGALFFAVFGHQIGLALLWGVAAFCWAYLSFLHYKINTIKKNVVEKKEE